MLEYLVTSSVRRRLLLSLFGLRPATGTAGELAKRTDVAFSHAHGELKQMLALGWLTVKREGTREVYAANLNHPQTTLLQGLVGASAGVQAREQNDGEHQTWLARLKLLGAPLRVETTSIASVDPLDTLVDAVAYSRRDATVARALPVAIWNTRDALTGAGLAKVSARPEDKHALGFMLELTGDLGNDRRLNGLAEVLLDRRLSSTRPYFYGSTKSLVFPLARRWGFTMNMDREVFATLFAKFVKDTVPSGASARTSCESSYVP